MHMDTNVLDICGLSLLFGSPGRSQEAFGEHCAPAGDGGNLGAFQIDYGD